VTDRGRGRSRQRGVILVLVLWVFMTLGVLALDFSSYMRDDATAALNLSDETRGYYLALAGMNRALYENNRDRHRNPAGVVQRTQDPDDPEADPADIDGDGEPDLTLFQIDGAWHEETFAGGRFAVRLSGEDGKIPLNVDLSGDELVLYKELVKFVVTNLVRGGNQTTGVDQRTAQNIDEVVDSIIDWRDCDTEAQLNGAEDDYYLGLPRPHRAKNGFFDSPAELLQVRGVTPELFFGHDGLPGLVDVFSPYPRGRELVINAGQITPQVVRALVPGDEWLPVEDAQSFLEGRNEAPEDIRTWLVQQLELSVPGLGSRVQILEPEVVRVEARADLREPRSQASVMAIVQMGNESDLPVILSWLDRAPLAADGPGAPPPDPAGTGAS
jgi:type II secretory pathway component PulK